MKTERLCWFIAQNIRNTNIINHTFRAAELTGLPLAKVKTLLKTTKVKRTA
jgi:hypothetical protein